MTIVWDLAAKFSLEAVGVTAGVAGLIQSFSALERQATVAELAVKRLNVQAALTGMSQAERQTYRMETALAAQTAAQERLNLATGAMQKMLVGGVMVTGGLAIVGELKKATDLASQFTQTMTGVQIATNASPSQMAALQKLTVQQGTRTQFSMNEEAGILAALTKARIDNVSTLTAMLPSVTNFAEVMKMARGVAPEQSATTAAEFAHLFGQYSSMGGKNGPGMQYMTNLLGRALAVTPATPDEFKNLVSQFAGTMRPLYGQTAAGEKRFISDAISTAMLEAQMGQQTRGGTQIAQMISRTLGGASATGNTAQDKALRQLSTLAGGRSFFNQQGVLKDMSNTLTILELAAAHPGESPEKVGQLYKAAFGIVGNRQAGLLSEKVTVQQFAQIGKMIDPKTGIISLDKIRQMYNQTPQGQQARALHNLQTLETEIGLTFIPLANAALGPIANLTAAIANMAADHPLLTKIASAAAGVAGAFLTVAGAVKLFKGAWDIQHLTGMINQLKTVAGLTRGATAAAAAGEEATAAGAGVQAAGAGAAGAGAAGAGVAGLVGTLGTVAGVAGLVGAWAYTFQNFGQVLDAWKGKYGPIWQSIAQVASPLIAGVGVVKLLIGWWDKLNQVILATPKMVHTAVVGTQANVGSLVAGVAGGIERILVPGMPRGLLIGGSGTATGTGGGGIGGGGLAAAALPMGGGAAVVHRHYHLNLAPNALGGVHVHGAEAKSSKEIAEEVGAHVIDALSRQWGHGGQWGNTDPVGLQIGPFGY